MSRRAENPDDELVHPVYLDVPMLIGFLAALEDGISLEDQSTSRTGRSAGHEREVRARAGLPSILTLLNLDMAGRLSAKSEDQAIEEVVAVKRHTEASLFNRLRARLMNMGVVHAVDSSGALGDLNAGALVEIRGEVVGNPLIQMSQVVLATAPFAGVDIDALLQGKYEKPAKQRSKSGVPAAPEPPINSESASGLRSFLMMTGQLLNSPVRDVVLRSEGNLSTVMTVASSFVEESVDAYLYESDVRVLGKLTRVVREGDPAINLMRRTTLGFLPRKQIAEMIETSRDSLDEGLDVEISDAFVDAPALQVLPLAIFV